MFSLSFIRIVLIVMLSSLCVSAQVQQSGAGPEKTENAGTGTITGRVVSENGQPLPNAVVSVRTANAPSGQAVATDREGTFQVNGLDQSLSYYISASMPAYTSPIPEAGATANPTYRAGDSVTFKLIKGGVITGTVTSATGQPLVGIRVRALMVMRRRNGRLVPNGPSQERETDDRGTYRIYGLWPGTYVVTAGGAGNSWSSATTDPYDTDVPTYAPSSTRDTASEINVRAGEETNGIDIRYRGEQGRVVSGVVSSSAEVAGFNVRITPVGEGDMPWTGSHSQMSGKAFFFTGIADGDYDLYAYSHLPNREYGVSDVKRIRVRGADVTGIELTTRPLGTVAGRLILEETKVPECTEKTRLLFEEMTVGAWHNDTEAAKEIPPSVWSLGSPAKPAADGNFVVRNLAPGEYYFAVRLGARDWYVRSIQFAPPSTAGAKKAIDATRVWTNVKFGDRLSGLAITLAQGGGALRAQLVLGEGEQVPPRTFVYLAPVERERAENALSYFGTPVSSEGKIAINNIAPGRYWIFAQTVGEDAPVPLTRIRFPHENETRAQIRREAEAAKTEIEFKPCQNVVDFKLPLKPRE